MNPTRGVRLTEKILGILRDGGVGDPAWLTLRRWVAVRATWKDTEHDRRRGREVSFELQDDQGKWAPAFGFRYESSDHEDLPPGP